MVTRSLQQGPQGIQLSRSGTAMFPGRAHLSANLTRRSFRFQEPTNVDFSIWILLFGPLHHQRVIEGPRYLTRTEEGRMIFLAVPSATLWAVQHCRMFRLEVLHGQTLEASQLLWHSAGSPEGTRDVFAALLLCPDLLFSSFSRFLSGGPFLDFLLIKGYTSLGHLPLQLAHGLPVLFFGQLFEVDRGHFDQGVIKGCWLCSLFFLSHRPFGAWRWVFWLPQDRANLADVC
mmetsp:Transcript_56030/g.114070  ORF Transcript_56030/g.114070 Transcript_56030/m.114070 type:complete len:231 (+) Transcript_56030:71-763(+)